jgi:hypothetical protein
MFLALAQSYYTKKIEIKLKNELTLHGSLKMKKKIGESFLLYDTRGTVTLPFLQITALGGTNLFLSHRRERAAGF